LQATTFGQRKHGFRILFGIEPGRAAHVIVARIDAGVELGEIDFKARIWCIKALAGLPRISPVTALVVVNMVSSGARDSMLTTLRPTGSLA
jgi:hypothetical protein